MSVYSRLATLALVAFLLAGCGAKTVGSLNPVYSTNLTGNWYFTTLYPGNVPQNIAYVGALTQESSNITAVLHNSCYSGDIDLSGTEDTSGNLTLTSSTLPDNVLTIQGTVISSGIVIETSSYTFTVTGSGPCALAATSLSGSLVPSFTGSFGGKLNSTTGSTASFSLSLTQKSATVDGEFPLSGSLFVSSSTCAVDFPVSSLFAGASFSANLTSSSGPSSTAVLSAGPVNPSASLSVLTNFNITITGCNAGTFTGSLNSQ